MRNAIYLGFVQQIELAVDKFSIILYITFLWYVMFEFCVYVLWC